MNPCQVNITPLTSHFLIPNRIRHVNTTPWQ